MLVHIQILRFFAAAAVVAFHAWGLAPTYINVPEGTWSLGLDHAGHGVDLFFVISGFIICFATHRSPPTPAAFLRRRVERIVPLYFFVILVVTALAFALPDPFDTPGWFTPQHILKSLAFISFTDGVMPVVFVGWSLEYEMYFYLCVALLMAATHNVWRNVVVVFCAVTMVGLIPGVAGALGNHTFFTDPLVLEFVLGVLIGKWFVSGRPGNIELAVTACAFAALLIADPANRAIIYGLPSAALVVMASTISRLRPKPSAIEYALERLGDASYSIYLAQVNTIWLACKYTALMVPEIAPMALVAVATTVCIALGLLLNIFVERPLLAFCRSLGAPHSRRVRA